MAFLLCNRDRTRVGMQQHKPCQNGAEDTHGHVSPAQSRLLQRAFVSFLSFDRNIGRLSASSGCKFTPSGSSIHLRQQWQHLAACWAPMVLMRKRKNCMTLKASLAVCLERSCSRAPATSSFLALQLAFRFQQLVESKLCALQRHLRQRSLAPPRRRRVFISARACLPLMHIILLHANLQRHSRQARWCCCETKRMRRVQAGWTFCT